MTDPATDASRDRLQTWLLRNDHRLYTRACEDIDGSNAISGAVRGKKVIAPTQLQALLNTSKMCPAHELRKFVQSRKKRRAKAGKTDAAAFWKETVDKLSALDREIVDQAAEAVGAPDTSSASLRDGSFDRRTVQTLITRRYLAHFVAHCQFLQSRSLN
jgi:hypothetical protein